MEVGCDAKSAEEKRLWKPDIFLERHGDILRQPYFGARSI